MIAWEHAKQLISLMKTVPGKVNLIPFNSFAGIDYQRSSNSQINRFRDVLRDNGVIVTVRRTRGDDIEGRLRSIGW